MKNILLCFLVSFASYIYGQIDPSDKTGPQISPACCSRYYCSKMHNHTPQSDKFKNPDKIQKLNGCPSSLQAWGELNDVVLIEQLKLYSDFECFRPLFNFDLGNWTEFVFKK